MLEDVENNITGYEQAAQTAYYAPYNARVMTTSFYYPSEYSSETSDEVSAGSYGVGFNLHGMSIFCASGDNWSGIYNPPWDTGSTWPAYSHYVNAVGGTRLFPNSSTSRGWSEANWGQQGGGEWNYGMSGWGCSTYETQPTWQVNYNLKIQPGSDCLTNNSVVARANSDMSASVGPFAIYNSAGGGWQAQSGTSVASPLVASIFALSGSYGTLGYPYLNSSLFNDIVPYDGWSNEGSCGTGNPMCNVSTGWDGPTGIGSPNASTMISTSSTAPSSLSIARFETSNGGWITAGSSWVDGFYVPGGVFLPGPFLGLGDENDDIAYVYDSGGNAAVAVHVVEDEGFTQNGWTLNGGPPWRANAQWLTGDFNGDGYADLAQVSPTGGNVFQIDVLVNNSGSSFTWYVTTVNSPGGYLGANGTWVAGHFQGNVTSDLAYVFEDSGGTVSIDVYKDSASYVNEGFGIIALELTFTRERWITQSGTWTQPAATYTTGSSTSWSVTPTAQWRGVRLHWSGWPQAPALWVHHPPARTPCRVRCTEAGRTGVEPGIGRLRTQTNRSHAHAHGSTSRMGAAPLRRRGAVEFCVAAGL